MATHREAEDLSNEDLFRANHQLATTACLRSLKDIILKDILRRPDRSRISPQIYPEKEPGLGDPPRFLPSGSLVVFNKITKYTKYPR